MTRIMKEKTVVGFSVRNKPMHCANDIRTRRSTSGILLVIRQYDHIVISKSIPLIQKRLQIPDIVDTTFKLIRCARVIYPDQQRLQSNQLVFSNPLNLPSVYQYIENSGIGIVSQG